MSDTDKMLDIKEDGPETIAISPNDAREVFNNEVSDLKAWCDSLAFANLLEMQAFCFGVDTKNNFKNNEKVSSNIKNKIDYFLQTCKHIGSTARKNNYNLESFKKWLISFITNVHTLVRWLNIPANSDKYLKHEIAEAKDTFFCPAEEGLNTGVPHAYLLSDVIEFMNQNPQPRPHIPARPPSPSL